MPVAHSKAEMEYVAGCWWMRRGTTPTADELMKCMRDGDACALFDARMDSIVIDYDEAKWHQDFERDARKVDRGDALSSVETIVKFRRGVGALQHTSPKLVQIECKSYALFQQMVATYEACKGHQNLTFFLHAPRKDAAKACKHVALDAYKRIDALTLAAAKKVEVIFGSSWRKVYNTHGIKSRLWLGTLVASLEWLKTVFGAKMAARLMSGGVAARIETETFRTALVNLVDVFGAAGTVTLMSDSVAARIETETFRSALVNLVELLGADRTAEIMDNCISSRLDDPTLLDSMRTVLATAMVELGGDGEEAYKVVRKLFHNTPYVRLFPKLDAMLDSHNGAVGLVSHLDSANGSSYKRRKTYVDSFLLAN